MPAFYKGEPIFGPRGPAGPDGNPVGTVISFMGTSAPEDYLVCDGAEYPIGDYPDLAEHFRQQFGAAGHFGGDGENTFAVPDLRNLFLRGYHGEAEKRLSGEVGEKQDATVIPQIGSGGTSNINSEIWALGPPEGTKPVNMPLNAEYENDRGASTLAYFMGDGKPIPINTLIDFHGDQYAYTTRPVNMAVLYCIKAVENVPAENVYSTEEQRIGIWIDGKPLYQKTIVQAIASSETTIPVGEENIANIVGVEGTIYRTNDAAGQLLSTHTSDNYGSDVLYVIKSSSIVVIAGATLASRKPVVYATIKYTKTTD